MGKTVPWKDWATCPGHGTAVSLGRPLRCGGEVCRSVHAAPTVTAPESRQRTRCGPRSSASSADPPCIPRPGVGLPPCSGALGPPAPGAWGCGVEATPSGTGAGGSGFASRLHLPGSQSLPLRRGCGSSREPRPTGCSERGWGTAVPRQHPGGASRHSEGRHLLLGPREWGLWGPVEGAGALHPRTPRAARGSCWVRELSKVLAAPGACGSSPRCWRPRRATGGKQATRTPGRDECVEMVLREATEQSNVRQGSQGGLPEEVAFELKAVAGGGSPLGERVRSHASERRQPLSALMGRVCGWSLLKIRPPRSPQWPHKLSPHAALNKPVCQPRASCSLLTLPRAAGAGARTSPPQLRANGK